MAHIDQLFELVAPAFLFTQLDHRFAEGVGSSSHHLVDVVHVTREVVAEEFLSELFDLEGELLDVEVGVVSLHLYDGFAAGGVSTNLFEAVN